MARITLLFSNSNCPELYRIYFSHPLLKAERLSVRGKTGGAFADQGSFQWTSAVKALSVLLLRTAASLQDKSKSNNQTPAVAIEGGTGSLASSLDYAISKGTDWLIDVFGRDTHGRPLSRRLFRRSNPNRKRSGPAAVSLNTAAWDGPEILVVLNGRELSSPADLLCLADRLTRQTDTGGLRTKQPLPVQDFHAQTPHAEQPYWLSSFGKVLFQEIRQGLFRTDIFNRSSLAACVKGIQSHESFTKVAGKNRELVHPLDTELLSSNRLGLEEEAVLRKHLCTDRPIEVAFGAPGVAPAAIFYYLTWIKGYNFKLNGRHAHAVEIARKLIRGDFPEPPDICVLGVPPAATILGRGAHTDFSPVMILPSISQKIVTPGAASGKTPELNSGDYLFIDDDPSMPSFEFEELVRDGYLSSKRISSRHMEPDEVLNHLQNGDSSSRAILFFPHYLFNQWFNDCTLIPDPRKTKSCQELVLFAHGKLMRDRKRLKYVDIAIRDAWLELRQNDQALLQVVDHMLESREYLDVLTRVTGLHNVQNRTENPVYM